MGENKQPKAPKRAGEKEGTMADSIVEKTWTVEPVEPRLPRWLARLCQCVRDAHAHARRTNNPADWNFYNILKAQLPREIRNEY